MVVRFFKKKSTSSQAKKTQVKAKKILTAEGWRRIMLGKSESSSPKRKNP